MLGVWEQQAREGLIQFIGILKVNVILLGVKTTSRIKKLDFIIPYYTLKYFIHI